MTLPPRANNFTANSRENWHIFIYTSLLTDNNATPLNFHVVHALKIWWTCGNVGIIFMTVGCCKNVNISLNIVNLTTRLVNVVLFWAFLQAVVFPPFSYYLYSTPPQVKLLSACFARQATHLLLGIPCYLLLKRRYSRWISSWIRSSKREMASQGFTRIHLRKKKFPCKIYNFNLKLRELGIVLAMGWTYINNDIFFFKLFTVIIKMI